MMRASTCLASLCVGLVLLSTAGALAQERFGNDLGPEPFEQWEGEVDYAATAGTLLTCQDFIGTSVCEAVPSSTAEMVGVPESRRILRAYLIWSASKEYLTPSDLQVDLTLPGAMPVEISASPDEEETIDLDDLMVPLIGTFEASWFTARADITDLVQGHINGGGDLNGQWGVGGLDIAHGSLEEFNTIWVLGSVTVGGWSVLLVHEPAVPSGNRKIFLYTGFEWLSGGTVTLAPSGFIVPGMPNARFTTHILEGDSNLTGDSISFNGARLTDGCNPSTNAFNDTVNTNTGGACRTGVFGVDLDTFVVGEHLSPGDEEAEVAFSVPSEQIFTNYLIMAFDSVPEFLKPTKLADPSTSTPVSIGQQITYTIAIQNRGTGPATNVIITDPVPQGTRYVAGSTRVDGDLVVEDPMPGANPLQNGLLLDPIIGGPIPNEGEGSRHNISFTVEVTFAPTDNTITNEATIGADGIEDVLTNLTTHPVSGGQMDAGMEEDVEPPVEDVIVPEDDADEPEPDATMMMPDTPDPNPDPNPAPTPDMNPDVVSPNPCGPGTILNEQGQCVPICGPGTSFVDGQCIASGGTTDTGCGCQTPASPANDPRMLFLLGALFIGLTLRLRGR